MRLDGRRHFHAVLLGIVKERAKVFGELRPRLFVSHPFLFKKPDDTGQEILRNKVGDKQIREQDGWHSLELAAPLGGKCPSKKVK